MGGCILRLLGGGLLIAACTGHHGTLFLGGFRSRAGNEGSGHGSFPKFVYNFEDRPLTDFMVFSLTIFLIFFPPLL